MMQLEGFQTNRACDLAHVSRAGFYRHYEEHEPRQADVELRDLIQRIVLENRFYGYRRVTAELDHRGVAVNHKQVLRLMRTDNLLAVRLRRNQRAQALAQRMMPPDSRSYSSPLVPSVICVIRPSLAVGIDNVSSVPYFPSMSPGRTPRSTSPSA